jgi:hypothetical protein
MEYLILYLAVGLISSFGVLSDFLLFVENDTSPEGMNVKAELGKTRIALYFIAMHTVCWLPALVYAAYCLVRGDE